MAVKVITPEVLTLGTFDVDALAVAAATVATDGFTIDISNVADHKRLLVFENVSAVADYTATIKKGNGLQGVADLVSADVVAGKFACIVIESGKYKNMSGTNKGKLVVLPEHVDLKMAAVVLP